jgi:hypothetical protein
MAVSCPAVATSKDRIFFAPSVLLRIVASTATTAVFKVALQISNPPQTPTIQRQLQLSTSRYRHTHQTRVYGARSASGNVRRSVPDRANAAITAGVLSRAMTTTALVAVFLAIADTHAEGWSAYSGGV